MYKIAVLGERDSIYGFASLGLEIFPAENREEAKKILSSIAGGEYAVIYVTEKTAAEISAEIAKYDEMTVPAIIPIPGVTGNTGAGMQRVREAVEKAVGSDIIFNNK